MDNAYENEEEPLIVEAGGIDYVSEDRRHGHPSNQFTIRFSPVNSQQNTGYSDEHRKRNEGKAGEVSHSFGADNGTDGRITDKQYRGKDSRDKIPKITKRRSAHNHLGHTPLGPHRSTNASSQRTEKVCEKDRGDAAG